MNQTPKKKSTPSKQSSLLSFFSPKPQSSPLSTKASSTKANSATAPPLTPTKLDRVNKISGSQQKNGTVLSQHKKPPVLTQSKENNASINYDRMADLPSSDGLETLSPSRSGKSSPSRNWSAETSTTIHPSSSPVKASSDPSKRVCALKIQFYFINTDFY